MIIRIDTLEDRRLDAYVRLTEVQLRSRLEPEKGIFIAESEKVITRALDAGYQPLSLLIPEHRLQRSAALVERIEEEYAGGVSAVATFAGEGKGGYCCPDGGLPDSSIPIFVAPAQEIEKLTGFELTRGVLCAMKRKPLPSLEEFVGAFDAGKSLRVAVLEDITNHTNVGAVFRNAAALGFDGVIVSPGCCDPLYRRAIRVSMGTVFQIPWTRFDGTVEQWHGLGCPSNECTLAAQEKTQPLYTQAFSAVGALKALGFTTVALALHSESLFLDDARLKQSDCLAVLLGTEGEGLSKNTISACDYVAKIPMREGVDSLNVAAASAVAFWEMRAR